MCFLQPVDRLILTGILKQKTHRPIFSVRILQVYIANLEAFIAFIAFLIY